MASPEEAPTESSGVLREILVITAAFEENDRRMAHDSPGWGWRSNRQVNADRYQALSQLQSIIYQRLGFREAISTIRPEPFYFFATSLFVLGTRIGSFISAAHADGFTPPLGMSQKDFSIIVFMLVGVFIFLILGLFWAGFIAKPKSAAAASAVQHGNFSGGSNPRHKGLRHEVAALGSRLIVRQLISSRSQGISSD